MKRAEYNARQERSQEELAAIWGLETNADLATLHGRLAAKRIADYPEAYRGSEEDALAFVRNNYPTTFDAALACQVLGA